MELWSLMHFLMPQVRRCLMPQLLVCRAAEILACLNACNMLLGGSSTLTSDLLLCAKPLIASPVHVLLQVFGSHAQFKDWFSNPLTGMVEGSAEVSTRGGSGDAGVCPAWVPAGGYRGSLHLPCCFDVA
jgi:hypothetical protein